MGLYPERDSPFAKGKMRTIQTDVAISLRSSRTERRTGREKVPSPSITLGRSASGGWVCRSCFMTTIWTSLPRGAPSPSEASRGWGTTGGLWTAVAGRLPSWVGDNAFALWLGESEGSAYKLRQPVILIS